MRFYFHFFFWCWRYFFCWKKIQFWNRISSNKWSKNWRYVCSFWVFPPSARFMKNEKKKQYEKERKVKNFFNSFMWTRKTNQKREIKTICGKSFVINFIGRKEPIYFFVWSFFSLLLNCYVFEFWKCCFTFSLFSLSFRFFSLYYFCLRTQIEKYECVF